LPAVDTPAVLSAADRGGAIRTGTDPGSNNGGRESNSSAVDWFVGGLDVSAGRFPGRRNKNIKPMIRAVESIRARPCFFY